MEYELIHSRRRTLALQMKADGTLLVRAPLRSPRREIDSFLLRNGVWVRRQRA